MRVVNLLGQTFGRLTVIKQADARSPHGVMWVCRCACGRESTVRGKHLRAGRTQSCGCLQSEQTSVRTQTHGRSRTRVYRIWRAMINRCHYPRYPERHLYGGRGIVVCERWRESFEAFLADMGEPAPHLSIDRIDPDGNYEAGNCRWATAAEQARNRRVVVHADEVAA